jgi:hypothetical protein
MTGSNADIPWTLVAAAIAAAASIIGVVLSTLAMKQNHRREIAYRIYDRAVARVAEIHTFASDYIGWMCLYTDYKEGEAVDDKFGDIQKNMMTAINRLSIMLSPESDAEISTWHSEMIDLAEEEKFDECNVRIQGFADIIRRITDPLMIEAEERLQKNK